MLRHGYEDTNGIVIGEMYKRCRLFYENRDQFSFTVLKESDAREKAENWIKQTKQELGQMLYQRLYPDDSWELRIY